MTSKEEVMEALKGVIDPHLGVNIVDMGFIYDVEIGDKIKVKMSLTTPGCPMATVLLKQAKEAIGSFYRSANGW